MAERELGVENVNTGLRRSLEEEESSEEEDDDEEMADVGVKVTSARRTSTGQVEFDMSEVKKQHQPDAKSRSRKEIAKFAATGMASDPR